MSSHVCPVSQDRLVLPYGILHLHQPGSVWERLDHNLKDFIIASGAPSTCLRVLPSVTIPPLCGHFPTGQLRGMNLCCSCWTTVNTKASQVMPVTPLVESSVAAAWLRQGSQKIGLWWGWGCCFCRFGLWPLLHLPLLGPQVPGAHSW